MSVHRRMVGMCHMPVMRTVVLGTSMESAKKPCEKASVWSGYLLQCSSPVCEETVVIMRQWYAFSTAWDIRQQLTKKSRRRKCNE